MFQLQTHLRALLGQPAILESVRKLSALADTHEKLRLGDQLLRPKSLLLYSRRQARKVHIRGEVLLARSFIRAAAHRMLTNRLDRAAMAPGNLFLLV